MSVWVWARLKHSITVAMHKDVQFVTIFLLLLLFRRKDVQVVTMFLFIIIIIIWGSARVLLLYDYIVRRKTTKPWLTN